MPCVFGQNVLTRNYMITFYILLRSMCEIDIYTHISFYRQFLSKYNDFQWPLILFSFFFLVFAFLLYISQFTRTFYSHKKYNLKISWWNAFNLYLPIIFMLLILFLLFNLYINYMYMYAIHRTNKRRKLIFSIWLACAGANAQKNLLVSSSLIFFSIGKTEILVFFFILCVLHVAWIKFNWSVLTQQEYAW